MSTKTLYTCVWGDYWKKFGKQWLNNVSDLNTKPDQIIVVSDKDILNCPYQVFLFDPNSAPHSFNLAKQIALNNCNSTWICQSDIDDIMLPNYLDNINDNYDVHPVWMKTVNENKKHLYQWKKNSKEIWNNMLHYDELKLPFPGRSFIKTRLAKQIGFSKLGYEDYIFWLRLRVLMPTININFNNEEKFCYTYSTTGLTNINQKNKIKESEKIKRMLKTNANIYIKNVL